MYQYRGKVIRVIDGDTVVMDIDVGFGMAKIKEHIRLARIDTPEVRGEERPLGLKSKEFVVEWMKSCNWEVIVETQKEKGKYGRYIGEIYRLSDGQNLSTLLLEEGLAVEYGK